MPLTYYVSFDFDIIGDFVFDVTADSNSDAYTITLATGQHYADLVDGTGITSLITTLVAALNAAAPVVTWTGSWDNSNQTYTITDGGGAFAATLNVIAQTTLGMAGFISGSASQSSTTRPFYVLVPAEDSIARTRGNHEPRPIAEEAETDGGLAFSVSRTTAPKYEAWEQMFEPNEATHKHAATLAVPWTWEDLFEHARSAESIVLVTVGFAVITYGALDVQFRFRIRGEGSGFAPVMHTDQVESHWDVPFLARVLERFS